MSLCDCVAGGIVKYNQKMFSLKREARLIAPLPSGFLELQDPDKNFRHHAHVFERVLTWHQSENLKLMKPLA